jgi:ABC-type polysaccharide/polyol phosphate export permease
LTHLICSARDLIIYGRLYDPTGFALSSIFAAGLFVFSLRIFHITESKVIERML